MATTLRNVFERVCSFENLWLAYTRARRGKRYGEPAAWFDRRAENRILDLGVELREGRYWPGAYHHFWIREPKRRKISAAPAENKLNTRSNITSSRSSSSMEELTALVSE